ncbi:fumarate/nitrate reduction transcriptional regulator Fnr [Thermithiobacillus plumbiphilus]|uniref:Fumarate/nitrate reduction transcriptional regulator Fnr n=1 Tax=Thermithiobacillus plumbiphilus TaxID=1729899 RepID=A0ABU9DAI2_9PROT
MHDAQFLKREARLKIACSSCNLRQLCLPVGLDPEDIEQLDAALNLRQRVQTGQHLYRAGDIFRSLYAIRSGVFKLYRLNADGREQVMGFYLPGDLMGLGAIGTGRFALHAVALEDSHICEAPFSLLEELAQKIPSLQRQIHRVLSAEILQDWQAMMMLGSMLAEGRLAVFLLDLSERLQRRGFSPTHLHLSMSREEIGNYLGMKLETVSRTFSKLQKDGLIAVDRRVLTIQDMPGLKRLAGCAGESHLGMAEA